MAFAFLLLLTACSPQGNARGKTVETILGAADTALPSMFAMAIPDSASATVKEAAERFCGYASMLSKGSFTLSAQIYDDPLKALNTRDEIKLAIVDGKAAEKLHPMFGMINEPFTYRSYESFSMTLNSAALLQKLSDATGLNVFSAYYTGSHMLLSPKPLDNLFARDSRNMDRDADGENISAKGVPGTGTASALALLGTDAGDESRLTARVDALLKNGAVIEVAPEELAFISFSAYGGAVQDEDFILTRTFHTAKPIWLLLAPAFYESLTPSGRAAVDDAAAALYNEIDKRYLEAEALAAEAAAYDNLTLSSAYNALYAGVFGARAQNGEAPLWEKEFRALLGRL